MKSHDKLMKKYTTKYVSFSLRYYRTTSCCIMDFRIHVNCRNFSYDDASHIKIQFVYLYWPYQLFFWQYGLIYDIILTSNQSENYILVINRFYTRIN